MTTLLTKPGYVSKLSCYETQLAIGTLKRSFEDHLSRELNLCRVSAPLFVDPKTGLNDDLNGVERPVQFEIPGVGMDAQIVHSLAKWKRLALWRYDFPVGRGLYTDMNAVRRDEAPDNLHSVYVDQWDWEKVIDCASRNLPYLMETVKKIVNAVCDTQDLIRNLYPTLTTTLSRDVSFVTTQQLEDLYPDLTPKERENAYLKQYKTAFIMQIGDKLHSGIRHDGRAPDYDDWSLNGDIMFWNTQLECAFELSSMGIRVDPAALDSQLTKAGADARRALPFHKLLLEDQLPLTMGGGIGQSRLCMLLLEKMHIGEVQVSLWGDETVAACLESGIVLL